MSKRRSLKAPTKMRSHTHKTASKKKNTKSSNFWKIPLVIISSALGVFLLWIFFLAPAFSDFSNAFNPDANPNHRGDLSTLNKYPFQLVSNVPTMVDLGSGSCVPCKMMAPILEELKQELKERANIVYIDVSKFPEAGGDFAINSIPTLIFYDKRGNEVKRKVGFTPKEEILEEFSRLGMSG